MLQCVALLPIEIRQFKTYNLQGTKTIQGEITRTRQNFVDFLISRRRVGLSYYLYKDHPHIQTVKTRVLSKYACEERDNSKDFRKTCGIICLQVAMVYVYI